MKKLLRSIVIALMLLCTLTLVACQEDDPKLTDQDVVNAAKEAFTINYTEVTTDFTLPTTAAGGVTVSWASSDAAIVISGQNAAVTRPAFADGNKSVVLTATLTKNEASATKEFTVVVVKLEDAGTIEALTVAEAYAADQGDTVTVRGIVSGFHWGTYNNENSVQGCYITDETGSIYVYGYLVAQEVEKGDDVILTAKVDTYKENVQLSSPTLVQTVSKGNKISSAAAITDKTVADLDGDLTTDYDTAAYIFEGVQVVKGATYGNYTLEDASGHVVNLYSSGDNSEFAWLDQYFGKELKVLFFVSGQNSKGTKWRGHILDVIEVVGDWSGSSDTPVTGTTESIANILAAAGALESGAKLEGNYQTTGTVKSIGEAYNSQYGNITFVLTDGTNDIECYRTKGAEAANVAVGDTVTVVGEVQNYNGKVEFAFATITARTASEGGTTPNPNPTPSTGTAITEPQVDTAYKMGMTIGSGKVVYLTGEMSGYYGASTESFDSAVEVFFEATEGGYNLYFMKNNVKTYIVITVNGTYYNITFQASPSYVWTWDSTYKTVTCDANGTKVFLGTYSTYSTFGGSDYTKFIATSYAANFYTEAGSGTTGGNTGGSTGGTTGGNEVLEGAVKVVIADYADANSWVNSTLYASINFDEFTTITTSGTQNGSYALNTGKYYENGENWRIYQNENPSLTITSTKTIVSVSIEYASQNTGTLTLDGAAVQSGAVVEVNGNTVTFSVGNTGSATNGQARITSITILYAE